MKNIVKILLAVLALSMTEASVFAARRKRKAATAGLATNDVEAATEARRNELKVAIRALNGGVLPGRLGTAGVARLEQVLAEFQLPEDQEHHDDVENHDGTMEISTSSNLLNPALNLGDVDEAEVTHAEGEFPTVNLDLFAAVDKAELDAAGALITTKQQEETHAKNLAYSAENRRGVEGAHFGNSNTIRTLTERRDVAIKARRQAHARFALLLKKQALVQKGTATSLFTLAGKASTLSQGEQELNAFIEQIQACINDLRETSGIMSAGTKAIYDVEVKPYDDLANALNRYVAFLNIRKAAILAAYEQVKAAEESKEVITTIVDTIATQVTDKEEARKILGAPKKQVVNALHVSGQTLAVKVPSTQTLAKAIAVVASAGLGYCFAGFGVGHTINSLSDSLAGSDLVCNMIELGLPALGATLGGFGASLLNRTIGKSTSTSSSSNSRDLKKGDPGEEI